MLIYDFVLSSLMFSTMMILSLIFEKYTSFKNIQNPSCSMCISHDTLSSRVKTYILKQVQYKNKLILFFFHKDCFKMMKFSTQYDSIIKKDISFSKQRRTCNPLYFNHKKRYFTKNKHIYTIKNIFQINASEK